MTEVSPELRSVVMQSWPNEFCSSLADQGQRQVLSRASFLTQAQSTTEMWTSLSKQQGDSAVVTKMENFSPLFSLSLTTCHVVLHSLCSITPLETRIFPG